MKTGNETKLHGKQGERLIDRLARSISYQSHGPMTNHFHQLTHYMILLWFCSSLPPGKGASRSTLACFVVACICSQLFLSWHFTRVGSHQFNYINASLEVMQSCIIILQQDQDVEWIGFAHLIGVQNKVRPGPASEQAGLWVCSFNWATMHLQVCHLAGSFFGPQILFSFTLFCFLGQGNKNTRLTIVEKPKYLQQTIIKNKIRDGNINKNLTCIKGSLLVLVSVKH